MDYRAQQENTEIVMGNNQEDAKGRKTDLNYSIIGLIPFIKYFQ